MSDYYILQDDGSTTPVDLMTWTAWMESDPQFDKRRVARTKIGEITVSTVFLGLNHRFGPVKEPPLLFETMVFGGEMDQEMERYSTLEESRQGHERIVDRVKQHE